jgi:hypothetical protein
MIKMYMHAKNSKGKKIIKSIIAMSLLVMHKYNEINLLIFISFFSKKIYLISENFYPETNASRKKTTIIGFI